MLVLWLQAVHDRRDESICEKTNYRGQGNVKRRLFLPDLMSDGKPFDT